MKATLGDILGGEVEIPADVQHAKIKDGQRILYQVCDNDKGAAVAIDELVENPASGLTLRFIQRWPASIDWIVEWEEIEKGAD